jgi:hypothetical protein
VRGPDETLTDEDEEEWDGATDVASKQVGASWDDLTDADRKLISSAQGREAFDEDAPTELPQPGRASSVRGLPKVKSGAFPRLIR